MQKTAIALVMAALSYGLAWGATNRSTRRTTIRPTIRPMMRMDATAFTYDAKPTAAGTIPHAGIVAADPTVLPLGSRIRVAGAGAYNGVYTVTDTGNKINGRHIDIYMPTRAAAREFGKKVVLVRILRRGTGKHDARDKDIPARTPIRAAQR